MPRPSSTQHEARARLISCGSRRWSSTSNSATALGVILAVFERHLSELAEGWWAAGCPALPPRAPGGTVRRRHGIEDPEGTAPLETVFGVRDVPVETAAAVRAAVDRLVQDGSVPESEPWRVLDVLAGGEH